MLLELTVTMKCSRCPLVDCGLRYNGSRSSYWVQTHWCCSVSRSSLLVAKPLVLSLGRYVCCSRFASHRIACGFPDGTRRVCAASSMKQKLLAPDRKNDIAWREINVGVQVRGRGTVRRRRSICALVTAANALKGVICEHCAVTDNSGTLTVDAPVRPFIFVRLSNGSTISTLGLSLSLRRSCYGNS